MVDLSLDAQKILDTYIVSYSGYRKKGENGATAFQNWYYQIRACIIGLDTEDCEDGINLEFPMPYWGKFIFNKLTIQNEPFILITDFKFNEANFFQFIKYHRYSKKGEPVIVGDLNFNYKLIKVQGSRLYGIMTPYDEVLIKPCYDRIIPFYHCSENFNRIHAIGIKNGRCFAIDLDGNTEKLNMNVNELMSIGCSHHHDLDESKLKKGIFTENNATTNKFRTKNVIRLTESQFHKMLVECITKIMKKIV